MPTLDAPTTTSSQLPASLRWSVPVVVTTLMIDPHASLWRDERGFLGVAVQPRADVLFGGLAMADGADGGLAAGGLAGGLFGAPLGGTLSQAPHLGARSLASCDGRRRPTGGCFGSGIALAVDGALVTVGGRCGGVAEVAM